MGRYDFRPIQVLQQANRLLESSRIAQRPPWHAIVAEIPPSETIVRPPKRFEAQYPGKRKSRRRHSSRMFQPLQIVYPEDKLRTTFFGDHPWELARPRRVVESDGNDGKNWNWSQLAQPKKAMDGESVVRRQLWLINDHKRKLYEARKLLAQRLSDKELELDARRAAIEESQESEVEATEESIISRQSELITEYQDEVEAAQALLAERLDEQTLEERMYDRARKEFYAYRLQQDVERQVAREEALHYGVAFEPSANERSIKFEDDAIEDWKEWALKDIEQFKHRSASMFSGGGASTPDEPDDDLVEEGQDATPVIIGKA